MKFDKKGQYFIVITKKISGEEEDEDYFTLTDPNLMKRSRKNKNYQIRVYETNTYSLVFSKDLEFSIRIIKFSADNNYMVLFAEYCLAVLNFEKIIKNIQILHEIINIMHKQAPWNEDQNGQSPQFGR